MTTPLQSYVERCDFATQLQDVNTLLYTAETKITFWGGRVLESPHYTGSVSLDEIARRTLQAACQRSESDDLTMEERVAGIEIVAKLRSFYRVSDTQICNSNFLTRLFNFIREFTFNPYTLRFYAQDGLTESYFRGFSREKYKQEFGGESQPNALEAYPYSDCTFGPPFRIVVKEQVLRERLAH